MRVRLSVALVAVLSACDQGSQSASATSAASAPPLTRAASPQSSVAPPLQICDPPANGVRIAADTIAGLPTDRPIEELDQRCQSDSVDDYGIGGMTAKARVYNFRGGRIAAVQSQRESALHPSEPADLWSAEGDSLRLPDNRLMPATMGELRATYPNGLVSADKGDDSDGVLAYVCAFPRLTFVLGYDTPTPADTGHWPLTAVAVPDSVRLWRIEVWPEKWWRTTAQLCAAGPASSSR